MTTNKPEVVAWRWRKPIVNDHGETVGGIWKLGGAPSFEPLIRLSDYEALQAECEKLHKDTDKYRPLLETVQREPVAYISHTSEGDILGWERQFDAPSHTPLYTSPLTAEQQPAPDVSALVEALEEARHHVVISPDPVRGGFIQEIDAALAAYRKGGDT